MAQKLQARLQVEAIRAEHHNMAPAVEFGACTAGRWTGKLANEVQCRIQCKRCAIRDAVVIRRLSLRSVLASRLSYRWHYLEG